jgi:hypothetical protein
MEYAILNDKGGICKTFLMPVIACNHAAQHPDEKSSNDRSCLHSNSSELVLGKNGKDADR